MRTAWAHQGQEDLRAAIWNWMTRPAREASMARSAQARKSLLIAYAFELWIRHLVLLEGLMELSPARWRDLRAAELTGLEMMRAARRRYALEYRTCGECGAPVRGRICPRCGALENGGK